MQQKNKKIFVVNMLIILVVLALIFVGYKVYRSFMEDTQAIQEYTELQKNVIDDEDHKMVLDFAKLSEINPEVVGWIHFEEPSVINYPIVQGEDNDKYLTMSFEGKQNGAGCIYMDADNKSDFSDKNTFVYGHNRRNGHMFGALTNYKDVEYFRNHPQFEIYTPDGYKSTYQIFSVTIVDSASDSYKRVYVNEKEYSNYIDMVKKLSIYDTGVEVTEDSYIVSLSTCTNVRIEERLIIHGVKINQEQTK